MATLKHKSTCTGGHEIYNFGRPFLGHYYILSLSEPYPLIEKKKYINFTLFIPKLPLLSMI